MIEAKKRRKKEGKTEGRIERKKKESLNRYYKSTFITFTMNSKLINLT